jgi:hypothetical protein
MKAMVAVAMLPGVLMAAGGTASGTLTVQGQTIQMKYAYAVQIPDFFDKAKMGTRLLVTDAPVPDAAVQEEMELMSLARTGKLNAIQFEIGSERSSVSMSVLSNKLGGSLSVSKGFDAKAVPVFTATRMEGTMVVEPSKLGPMTYQYNVKFATAIAPRVVAPAPTTSDAASAAKAASAQAYLAFVAAVRSGNKAKMLELASPKVRQMMDTPDFAQNLAMVQAMLPSKIQVLKATETGDEATLMVTGTEEGQTKRGTVTMMRQAGKWYIVKESWKSA